ncbi:Na/Pi cotransporter family protein [Natronospora cellulosivora (SeqCode)]
MSASMIFALFGGLGLFIYGMKQMSEGLQKTAGKRLKHLLGLLTTNRFAGLAVGTLVTAVIQSSSAATVMVVGFVNAGLMTLKQSIGVIMGANIGTTITAQLIAFRLSDFSLHGIAIGSALYLFSKKDRSKQIGQVILGFGMVFLGMSIMGDAMQPLKDSPAFIEFMGRFATSPLLGLLFGTLMTILLQSSSASIAVILSMVSVGIIDFYAVVPILLGDNIGTTITANLSSIGANRTAKRAAAAHFIFNFMGASLVIALFYIIPDFANILHDFVYRLSEFGGMGLSQERLLANTHTMFNILNTIVWIPFVGLIVVLVKKLIPGEDISIKRGLNFLDERMLETPGFAIDQLKAEVLRMYDIADEMVKETEENFKKYDLDLFKSIIHKEEIINELEEELVTFLTKFPRHSMSEEDVKTVDMYYAMIDDIESIADDAHDIAELARFKDENKIRFSDPAWERIKECFETIHKMLEDSHVLIEDMNFSVASRILEGEGIMDRYQIESRSGHMERLGSGVCDPNAGIVYLEVLDDLEHISDQMADMTHTVLETTSRKN